MANLEELTLYKKKLMKAFCSSEAIAQLLEIDGEDVQVGKSLMYTRVFPYLHRPDISESARSFICFDVSTVAVQNSVIKSVAIDVYVVSHQHLMRLADGKGMRIDVLSSEVDKLLNGSTDYGIGELELKFSEPITSISKYYGRSSRYIVKDFNRYTCGDVGADWT